jgi:hypothetical protein
MAGRGSNTEALPFRSFGAMDMGAARDMALHDMQGEEYDHFGKAAYRIPPRRPGGRPGRTFMTLWIDEGFAVLMLDVDLQTRVIDLAPGAFEPHPSKWGAKGATIARFEKLDERTFREALRMAVDHAGR